MMAGPQRETEKSATIKEKLKMLKDLWTNTNDLKQDRCAQGV